MIKAENYIYIIGPVDSGKSTLLKRIMAELEISDNQQQQQQQQQQIDNQIPTTINYFGSNYRIAEISFQSLKSLNILPKDQFIVTIPSNRPEFDQAMSNKYFVKDVFEFLEQFQIKHIIIALTKAETIQNSLAYAYLTNTIFQLIESKFQKLQFQIIPIDSKLNTNITLNDNQYYEGNPLMQLIHENKLKRKGIEDFRLYVDYKQAAENHIYCQGLVVNGHFDQKQQLTIQPKNIQIVVQDFSDDNRRNHIVIHIPTKQFKIMGAELEEVQIGSVICGTSQCFVTQEIRAQVQIREIQVIISSGFKFIAKFKHISIESEITQVKFTQKDQVVRNFLKSKEQGTVQIQFKQEICVDKYETVPSLGSFQLVSIETITKGGFFGQGAPEHIPIGVGQVTHVKPMKID